MIGTPLAGAGCAAVADRRAEGANRGTIMATYRCEVER